MLIVTVIPAIFIIVIVFRYRFFRYTFIIIIGTTNICITIGRSLVFLFLCGITTTIIVTGHAVF